MKKLFNLFLTLTLFTTIIPFNFDVKSSVSAARVKSVQIPNVCDDDDGSYSKSSLIIVSNNSQDVASIEAIINKDSNSNLLTRTANRKSRISASSLMMKSSSTSKSLSRNRATETTLDKFNKNIANSSLARSFEIKFPKVANCQELQLIIDRIGALPGIEAIHVNHISRINGISEGTPNDPLYNQQWGLARIKANEVWRQQITGTGVNVGVIDSQLFIDHPDILDNVAINYTEKNGVTNRDDDNNACVDDIYFCDIGSSSQRLSVTYDEYSHGTHVSGIIAAKGDNNKDVIGVAPNAKIIFASLSDEITDANIIKALQYLIRRNVKIVNLSLGQYSKTVNKSEFVKSPIYQAFTSAVNAGLLIIVAAGNEGVDVDRAINPRAGNLIICSGECFDAFSSIPGVLSVAATDTNNNRASFSNFGASVDIAAPGVSILSLGAMYTSQNKFVYNTQSFDGTSMAAPMVTGAAALLKSKYSYLSAAQISESLIKSASSLPGSNVGGLLNVENAIQYAFNTFVKPIGDFNIVSPVVNANLTTTRPTFTWSRHSNDNGFNTKYIVRVRNNDTKQYLINVTLSSGFYETPTQYASNVDLASGNYTLYVTATNVHGGNRVVSRNFRIQDEFNFSIISPTVNENLTTTKPTFSWTMPNVTSTDLQFKVIVRNNDIAKDLINVTLAKNHFFPVPTEFKPSEDLPSGNYTLSVTAITPNAGSKTLSTSFKITAEKSISDIVNSLEIRSNSLFYNHSRSKFEKHLFSSLTNKGYYVLPNGDFYESFYAYGGPVELINSTDKKLGNIGSSYYQDIRKFSKLSSLPLSKVIESHGLNIEIANNSVYFNHSGNAFEKWLKGKNGHFDTVKSWFKLMPNGDLLSATTNTVVLKLSSSYYTNINLFDGVNLNDTAMMAVHNYQPDSTGNTYFNWTGSNFEKWFYGRFGQGAGSWSYITPDGSLFFTVKSIAQTVPVMKLSSIYFVEPTMFNLITETSDQFFWLMNKADIKLRSYRADYQYNWSGQYSEKWLIGSRKSKETSTAYYYLLPDGRLYRYTGKGKAKMVVEDVLIAKVNPVYYDDPSKIVYTAR